MLPLAHQLQLTRVGTVSVEGTKLAANASQPAAVSCQRAGAMIAQWELEVKGLVFRTRTKHWNQKLNTHISHRPFGLDLDNTAGLPLGFLADEQIAKFARPRLGVRWLDTAFPFGCRGAG